MPPLNNLQKNCLTLAIGQTLLAPTFVQAARITVNTASDVISPQACTLRAALTITNAGDANNPSVEANSCSVEGSLGSNDEVNFDLPGGANTIALTRDELLINSTVSINGPGEQELTIDGQRQSRVLNVDGAANSTISGLTVTNGGEYAIGRQIPGGGIQIRRSNGVTLESVTISNSVSFGDVTYSDAGGIYITNSDGVSLNSVTVTNNTASYSGGGIASKSSDDLVIVDSVINANVIVPGTSSAEQRSSGAGLYIEGSDNVLIKNTTISGNSGATLGGGLGGKKNTGLRITQSTISNNQAVNGAGFFSNGDVETVVTNSTISSNTATYDSVNNYIAVGGGVRVGDRFPINFFTSMSMINVTINNNQALGPNAQIGGIHINNNASLSLTNSVVANSVAGDCNASVSSGTNNWFEDASCNGTANGDPNLGVLQNNGGPTLTHAPLPGSGLLNTGLISACQGDAAGVDQLNSPRGGRLCSIGAVEEAVEEVKADDESMFVIPLSNGKTVIFSL